MRIYRKDLYPLLQKLLLSSRVRDFISPLTKFILNFRYIPSLTVILAQITGLILYNNLYNESRTVIVSKLQQFYVIYNWYGLFTNAIKVIVDCNHVIDRCWWKFFNLRLSVFSFEGSNWWFMHFHWQFAVWNMSGRIMYKLNIIPVNFCKLKLLIIIIYWKSPY